MKIFMLSDSFLPLTGGLQYQVKYLIEALAEKNVEIYLLSYSDGEKYIKKNKDDFPRFIRLKKRSFFPRIYEIFNEIKKISPDVIHVHSAEISAFQISLLKFFRLINVPLIITSHGIDIMIEKSVGYGLRLNPIFRPILKFTLRMCKKHVLVGKTMRPYALDSGSDESKIQIINNGVPMNYDSVIINKLEEVSKKFGIEKNDKILLSLSGMRPLKAQDILVKSMPIILQKLPYAKLIMACRSNDSYEQSIRDLVKQLNLQEKVNFIGFVTDEEEKINLIRRCDVFCKPSRLEACSVAILEAMKEYRPVVASFPGGEDIIENGIDGIMTEVENVEAYATAVIQILENKELSKKIGEKAHESIINKFDVRVTAGKYIALFESLLLK